MKARILVPAFLLLFAVIGWSTLVGADDEDYVLLIRMPDEPGLAAPPSDSQILAFLAAHDRYLAMSPQDLLRDQEFARRTLGQRQIFEELSRFESEFKTRAKVRFIPWPDAFRLFSDYVSDSNPPVVAQVGDTWGAYFRSLGVVSYEQRHTWDVRLLWYWKDLVKPEAVADGEGFLDTCRRLRDQPPPGLEAPFVIPTALDWNLLHDLSIWLYNAELPALISTERRLGLFPWKEAVFAGPEGERAVRFLMTLARDGCVALPETQSLLLVQEFLNRKYALFIHGPLLAERAEKLLGPEWRDRIGAALPPTLGAAQATTVKGGSLFVVLDPTRGNEPHAIARGRKLVDFFASVPSQRRYTKALGALPANPQVLEESSRFQEFRTALDMGRAYTPIPEWAPVVENLATRDSLYAFWKRLSALADNRSKASPAEQASREGLILAAIHSAEEDINRRLSPGKLGVLWPWILAVTPLLAAFAAVSLWYRSSERRRVEELRQTRDHLATLQRRLVSIEDTASTYGDESPEKPILGGKGYPALYLHSVKRQVLLRKAPSEPLEVIIHGAEYDLFRYILECLQVGSFEIHWGWAYILWPTARPKFPKEAFATHCTKLRKNVERVWELGKMLGRGSHQRGAIPIEVRDVHFYTDAQPEGDAYPVWSLFESSEKAAKAYKAGKWQEARSWAERCLQVDPENWSGNLLIGSLVAQKNTEPDTPVSRQAVEFIYRQKVEYQAALELIADHPTDDQTLESQQKRIRFRLDILAQIAAQLQAPSAVSAPVKETRPWRTKEQLRAWACYLNGERSALAPQEIRVLGGVEHFVQQSLPGFPAADVRLNFREFIQDLALDEVRWPENSLASTAKALKYQVLDAVIAALYQLPDDVESSASTKAQNLRKLWSTRSRIKGLSEHEPSTEELYESCRRQYRWTRAHFERVYELEQFCRPVSFDDSRLNI